MLRRSGQFEPLQFAFPPSNRLMRVLGPVVGPQAAIVFCYKANGSKGRRIGKKLVRHNPARREAMLLEQLLQQLFGGFRISLSLDEEVQYLAFIVHGAPQLKAFPSDHDDHLIEVPVIAGLGTDTTQFSSDDGSKLQEPASDRLVGDVQAYFGEHLLHIAETRSKPRIQPDRMADNFRWKAVTLEGKLAHGAN